MTTQQPLAMRLADMYDYGDPLAHGNAWKSAVCTELRAQQARIAELEAQLAAAPQAAQVIKANCYSDDNGDYWRDCPDDSDFVDGLKVGDTYELQASIRSWSETFRVTKAPDETSDDYEVELVSTDAPLAALAAKAKQGGA